jgi:mannose-6-phosphate isomerase
VLYPLTFQPIFKERVWGGRRLADLYAKPLPAGKVVGESWEITDRPEGVSVIANGPLAGRDLRWAMEHHADEMLGRLPSSAGRFPWLIKILDCEDDLSLQVHPPASVAPSLNGEPKTEMWFVADARPGSKLYVGLRRGTTRSAFEAALRHGHVADCFHVVPVTPGDTMFVPGGRVHALGRGNVIFEIQQNSDTTYRVFDWNRLGLDGNLRPLHVEQSLASIDFNDFEPLLVNFPWQVDAGADKRQLVQHPLFNVSHHRLNAAGCLPVRSDGTGPTVVGVIRGEVEIVSEATIIQRQAGEFALLPASLARCELSNAAAADFLLVSPPQTDSHQP